MFSSSTDEQKKILKTEVPGLLNEILNAKELPIIVDDFLFNIL